LKIELKVSITLAFYIARSSNNANANYADDMNPTSTGVAKDTSLHSPAQGQRSRRNLDIDENCDKKPATGKTRNHGQLYLLELTILMSAVIRSPL